MKTYQKPVLNFERITPKRSVADNCWHNIANGSATHYYWDTNGTENGYYEFSFDANNCGDGQFASNLNMHWWEGRGDENPSLDPENQYDHVHGGRLSADHPDFKYLQDYGKQHFSEGVQDLIILDS